MADSSLDDFFAKKDKTKKKSKSKTGASGDDDGASKATKKDKKKKDKDKQNQSGGSGNTLSNPQEDEEWKDFEEEKEADYTGLRIQTLQMGKDDQDREGGDGDENGDDEDGENRDRRDMASGPWNKSGTPAPVAAAPAPVTQPEPVKDESTPKAPAKYVPPAQRQAAASSTPGFPTSRKKKEAPNVNSEEDFPTLGGGPTPSRGSSQLYSSTASSDLIDNPNQRKGVNLSLENKFSALQD